MRFLPFGLNDMALWDLIGGGLVGGGSRQLTHLTPNELLHCHFDCNERSIHFILIQVLTATIQIT